MRIIIDTCSLVALCRYYLPFDKNRVFYNLIKERVGNGEIIIIDKVLKECHGVSGKIVIKSFDFLTDKHFTKTHRIPYDTSILVAPDTGMLLQRIDTEFSNQELVKAKKIGPIEYMNQRDNYMRGADMTQIILCLRMIKDNIPIWLVTEETSFDNDNKLFKKIPFICSGLGIQTMTIPEYIEKSESLEINFRKKGYSTELIKPICLECKHIQPLSGGCQAFPNGIPRVILETNKHDKPIDGQKSNTVYTPSNN